MHFELAIPRRAPDAAAVREGTEEIAANELIESGAIADTPGADGNLSLENYPGSYRIVSMPPPAPWYMAAIRMGQAELTSADVELSSGAIPITVVYRDDGGSVGGTAKKCGAGLVILIPQDPAPRPPPQTPARNILPGELP